MKEFRSVRTYSFRRVYLSIVIRLVNPPTVSKGSYVIVITFFPPKSLQSEITIFLIEFTDFKFKPK